MPKKAAPKDDFKSVARRLECDESEERFNRALRTIAKQKLRPEPRKEARKAR
jgi:hypothetical protein